MFFPPQLDQVHIFFGDVREVKSLHAGESLQNRIEKEISIHQGQIYAENYLLNSFAKFQSIAKKYGISREALHDLLRQHNYSFEATQQAIINVHQVPESAFESYHSELPINTADMMKQRALMMGAVLSSTPIMIRDPWNGNPVTTEYGFTNHKANVGDISFSAIATPRYKDIPFRFAVMKHIHDGYEDNNPAMIWSNEFCDAFEQYNKEKGGNLPASHHPLMVSLATCLKPNIHDRFHNWLLYDVEAASETFKKWGDDIFFVEHRDKNPLLINYEQVALTFHLYTWNYLFSKNPELKNEQYQRLENCIEEIKKFGTYLKSVGHPQAQELEESTVYGIVSNIGFVLNPFEERFQKILDEYPDVKEKLLTIHENGRGVGKTLAHLHGGNDTIPSKINGSDAVPGSESVFEYIIRYPLHEEVLERLKKENHTASADVWSGNEDGTASFNLSLEDAETLPPQLREKLDFLEDRQIMAALHRQLAELPDELRTQLCERTEVSEQGYMFFRLDRHELDYSVFEEYKQQKKVLLVEVPAGSSLNFLHDKKLSLTHKVQKQKFNLEGGKDLLAINVRDPAVAKEILDYACVGDVVDAGKALKKAQQLAAEVGYNGVGDLYKIEKTAAEELYGFTQSGFYEQELTKFLAKTQGPTVMQLHSGGDQRMVNGALVYLPFGKNPQNDPNPDCHCIEDTDFKRDYNTSQGVRIMEPVPLFKSDSPLHPYQEQVAGYMRLLEKLNHQITHGRNKSQAQGLFV